MKVAIYSTDESYKYGYYSKIDGLLKAAKELGLDYVRWEDSPTAKYDVVINWEPFAETQRGKRLTIVWVWDTHRHSLRNACTDEKGNRQFDVLFRAHATFHHKEDLDPRQCPVYWMPPAVDEKVFKRDPEIIPKYDVVFVGQTRYMPEFDILNKNFKMLKIWGGLGYKDYVKALCKGRLVLNVPVALETNKRVMEAMAVGPALMPWGPDYTLLATPDKDFVCYFPMIRETEATVKEFEKYLVKKVKSYLDDPKLLFRIWLNGRSLIEERFTFRHQVQRIEEVIRKHVRKPQKNK